MLKLGRVTKVKVLFLVLVLAYSNVFEFSAAILEKGLLIDASFKKKILVVIGKEGIMLSYVIPTFNGVTGPREFIIQEG